MIIFFYIRIVVRVEVGGRDWIGEIYFDSFLQKFFGGMENLTHIEFGLLIEMYGYLVFLCNSFVRWVCALGLCLVCI